VGKESCIVPYKLYPFNSFLVYKNLNTGSKLKYKEYLVQVEKAWATDEIQAAQTQSDTDSVRP
jgi:hypothetical protein